MNKLLAILIVALFMTPVLVMAGNTFPAEVSYVFKNTETVDIKNPCFYSGEFCSNLATCRITVYYPTGDVMLDNGLMTNQNTFHNYTLAGPYPLGVYRADMVCTDNAISGAETFYFQVNPTGERIDPTLIFTVMMVGSALILFVALMLQNEYIGFISGVLFLLSGVYTIINGIGDVANLYTQGIGFVSIGLGVLFMIAGAYGAIDDSGMFKRSRDDTDIFEEDEE